MPAPRSPQNVRLGRKVTLGKGTTVGAFCEIGLEPDATRGTRVGRDGIIRSHTVIYSGNSIGDRFRTGHGAMIREDNAIGDDVSVGTHSIVEHHVEIENGVRIHSNCFVPEFTILRRGAWIGPCVTVTNARLPLDPEFKRQPGTREKREAGQRGPDVGEGAVVGAGSVLLPGISIGAGALVAAGSVVTKDVSKGAVVAGNPARLVKKVSDLACPPSHGHKPYRW